jgi:ribosomal protein L34E
VQPTSDRQSRNGEINLPTLAYSQPLDVEQAVQLPSAIDFLQPTASSAPCQSTLDLILLYAAMASPFDINGGNDLDDENVWVEGALRNDPLGKLLKSFDYSLRCQICKDLCCMPVLVQPCGHGFCSECVRNAFQTGLTGMMRKATCPTCRVKVNHMGQDWENALVPNHALELAIESFKALRGGLKDRLRKSQNLSGESQAESATSITQDDAGMAAAGGDADDREEGAGQATENETEQLATGDGPVASVERREPKRRVSYHALKKKQLQALCAEEGLHTHGTEEELIVRHRQFVTLYNATTKSLRPMSGTECAKEINQREAAMAQSVTLQSRMDSTTLQQYVASLNDGKDVKAGSSVSQFSATMNAKFAKLIAQGKTRLPQSGEAGERKNSAYDSSQNEDAIDEQGESYTASELAPEAVAVEASAAAEHEPQSNIQGESTVDTKQDATEASRNPYKKRKMSRLNGSHDAEPPTAAFATTKPTDTAVSAPPQGTSSIILRRRVQSTISSSFASSAPSNATRIDADTAFVRRSKRVLAGDSPASDNHNTINAPAQITNGTATSNNQHGNDSSVAATHARSRWQTSEWACPRCTLVNGRNKWSPPKCEACDAPRPTSVETIVID